MTQDQYEYYEEAWLAGKDEEPSYRLPLVEINDDNIENELELVKEKRKKQFKEW